MYERASGQVINRDKSSVLFSPNTGQANKEQVRAELCISHEAKSEKYLGLPVSIGKSRKKSFEYIKRKDLGADSRVARKAVIKGGIGGTNQGGCPSNTNMCHVMFQSDKGSM